MPKKFVRRGRKKRFGKKVVKRLSNPLRKGIPNSMRLIRVVVESFIPWTIVVPAGSANARILTSATFPLHFPGNYRNNAATYGPMPTLPGCYSTILGADAMFDAYRVLSLTLNFIPFAESTGAAGVVQAGADASWLMYHNNDVDDTALLSTENQAQNIGLIPLNMTHNRSRKFVYVNKVNKEYLNAQNVAITPAATSAATTSGITNPYASIKLMSSTLATSVPAATFHTGRVYARWEVILKGIRDEYSA